MVVGDAGSKKSRRNPRDEKKGQKLVVACIDVKQGLSGWMKDPGSTTPADEKMSDLDLLKT